MRRPKHRVTKRGSDEHVHDYSAHAPGDAFVRISVTEWKDALIVDLERVTGPVTVRWTDDKGKHKSFTLRRKEG